MKRTQTMAVGTLALLGLALSMTPAEGHGGGWSVGVRFGVPAYRPWVPYYPPPYYYRPVYVVPAPVYVQPAPVYLQPAPVSQPAYQARVLSPVVANAPPQDTTQAGVERRLQLLADPDEQVRVESVLYLGRIKAHRAIDPLAATLAGDRSPVVREAAARALALIGSPKALPALQQAGVADTDREVRHSAQFAVDVIQAGR